jgi:hypothetical protein
MLQNEKDCGYMKTRQSIALSPETLQVVKERAAKFKRSVSNELAYLVELGLRKESK